MCLCRYNYRSVWLLLVLATHTTGVTLEYRGVNLGNNSLVFMDDIREGVDALLCKTDKVQCCGEQDGNWYQPDGDVVPITANLQNLYVSRDSNQTVGLNFGANISESSFGLYSCEILDRLNRTNYLYVGIYPQNKGK